MTNIKNVLVNFERKNYAKALQELNKILIIDPNSVEKLNLKGVILQLLDKSYEARESWIKASNINNTYYDPYFNLGNHTWTKKIMIKLKCIIQKQSIVSQKTLKFIIN